MRFSYILTPEEEVVMDVFWKSGKEMLAVELVNNMLEQGYDDHHLSTTITSLHKKGYITIKQDPEKFYIPTITRDDYVIKLRKSKSNHHVFTLKEIFSHTMRQFLMKEDEEIAAVKFYQGLQVIIDNCTDEDDTDPE